MPRKRTMKIGMWDRQGVATKKTEILSESETLDIDISNILSESKEK